MIAEIGDPFAFVAAAALIIGVGLVLLRLPGKVCEDLGKINSGVDNFLYNQEKKRQENEKNGVDF